jgi:hypothetical protein
MPPHAGGFHHLGQAIEDAQAEGKTKREEKPTELLNAGKTTQAIPEMDGKPKAKKAPAKVEVEVPPPPSLHDDANHAYSEFANACAKSQSPAEVAVLEGYLNHMRDGLETARGRVAKQGTGKEEAP